MQPAARIDQEELQTLPRWARVAFAARCTRRAQTLLRGAAGPAQVLERAISLTEQACRNAQAGDDLADAAAAAYTLALNTLDRRGRLPVAGTALDEDDAVIVTCTVSHAVAFAAEAATISGAKMASYLVAQSVDFARHAQVIAGVVPAAEAAAAVRRDLEGLRQTALRQGWTDQTPVAPEFFGVL